MSTPRRVLRIAGAAALVLGLGACSAPGRAALGPSQPIGLPAPTQSGHPRQPAQPAVNPLTGGTPSDNPVVAVKIEDTAAGRPQLGIDKADIVYIEQVEGGLTRLLAIYDSVLPTVEPVRSTRANDPELAMQFGPIIYVASGGSRAELAPLDRSDLRSDINDRLGPGFVRDGDRAMPNDLRADLAVIAAKLKGPRAKSIGLAWSTKIVNPSTRTGGTVRTRIGATPVAFDWSAALHRYVRLIDGAIQRTADNKTISTPNVVVQFCRSTVYPQDRDVLGNPAQYTHTIGSGKVVVFRDGRRVDGTWTRSGLTDGTHLLDVHHRPIALAPGGVWFVLVATGTPLN
ncbi:MAG: DUF3048 domain-containing protein [Jatrophihabitantaceae bacterium]